MMYGYGLGWGSMWGFGLVFMVMVWALVILGIVALVRWLWSDKGWSSPDKALQILKERYARGEIGSEEYQARRKLLENS
ncbi:MAG: SHOCT domain-containing protein [Candidatus Kerfeldbacteria bacterium]|nr:SHOCT domain-containing protein [Candidatus Kerfeldbacteria bacterium]